MGSKIGGSSGTCTGPIAWHYPTTLIAWQRAVRYDSKSPNKSPTAASIRIEAHPPSSDPSIRRNWGRSLLLNTSFRNSDAGGIV